jgi:hypothetical protein
MLCILAAAALAQVRPNPAPPAAPAGPPKKPGSVEGMVTNSLTGQPIKKATVTLRSTQGGGFYLALSDAEGHFRMANVDAGDRYVATASCPGFTAETATRFTPVSPISVEEEQAVTGVVVKLSPLGVIAGKVIDENDEPLPYVVVSAVTATYPAGVKRMMPRGSATTDDRGEYRLFDLPPDRYYVAASLRKRPQPANVRLHSDQPDVVYPTALHPASADLAGATAITVAPGAEVTGIHIRLHKTAAYHIRGQAVDAQTRQPVPGGVVQARLCTFDVLDLLPGGLPAAAVRPDGAFDVSGAAPGLYCLTIQLGRPGGIRFAQTTVKVAGQDVNGVTLAIAPALEIPGTLLSETPLPQVREGLRVTLLPESGNGPSPNTLVKPDNSFVLQDVLPVSYQLQPVPLPRNFYLKSIHYGDQDVPDGRLNVTATATPLTLVFASDTGQVSVTVQAADGTPIPGAMVVLAPDEPRAARNDLLRTGFTRPDGVATIPNVAPGAYKVFAWNGMDDTLAWVAEVRKLLENRAVSVTVEAHGNQSVQAPLIPAEQIDEAKSKL